MKKKKCIKAEKSNWNTLSKINLKTIKGGTAVAKSKANHGDF